MNQKVAVSVVYVASMFMAIMDATIVNVALPTIARDFHTTPGPAAAAVIAFLVSLAVVAGSRSGGRVLRSSSSRAARETKRQNDSTGKQFDEA